MMIRLFGCLLLLWPIFVNGQFKKDAEMTHVLKNKNIELEFDLPAENYQFSRFDWSGKIVSVKYKGIAVSTCEKINCKRENLFGKAFYNEFGIESPVGFDDCKEGEFFPKIGIGTLKKTGEAYDFSKEYEVNPANFDVDLLSDRIVIVSSINPVNGYAYSLRKEIVLLENGFEIRYKLENTGKKPIDTDEYIHNFLAIDHELIGTDYQLEFPFEIYPGQKGAIVNPEKKVIQKKNGFGFEGSLGEQFFYSNLSAGKEVSAQWTLLNTKLKIGISEEDDFKTSKINLWGWKHVISPELFYKVHVDPGEQSEWKRTYHLFAIN